MTLVWTDDARDDLRTVLEGHRAYSTAHALRLERGVDGAVARLVTFPRSGRVVSEWEQNELREMIVERFRLIYRAVGDPVAILTLHPTAIPLG